MNPPPSASSKTKKAPPKIVLSDRGSRVAIVGAGLSGLATALQLLVQQQEEGRRLCASIDCYDPGVSLEEEWTTTTNSTKDGYGLTISYQPDGILQEMQVLSDMMQWDCPSRSHYILDAQGTILGYFGNTFRPENDITNQRGQPNVVGWGQRGNIRIPRHRLRQILYRKIRSYQTKSVIDETNNLLYPNVQFHWNHKLVFLHEVQSSNGENHGRMQLVFENGNTSMADFVIAADGIRSTVAQYWLPKLPPPVSLQVRVILGITDANAVLSPCNTINEDGRDSKKYPPYHELLHERGFYTLSNGHRFFVMPYSGSALHRSLDPNEPVRFMWQLSFASSDDTERRYTSQQLKNEALNRTINWHAPVSQLIQSTSSSNVWGTMLRDRNPEEVLTQLLQKSDSPRVLVIGDALHAMSPFKGQGANQCFRDAVTVSKWLYASAHKDLSIVIKCATREMVQRTAPVVAASRTAAQYWHSDATEILNPGDHPFTALDGVLKHRVLLELQNRRINAGTTSNLDDVVWDVIRFCSSHQINDSANENNSNGNILPSTPILCPIGKSSINDDDSVLEKTSSQGADDTAQLSNSSGDVLFVTDCLEHSVFLCAFKGEADVLRQYSLQRPNLIRRLTMYPDGDDQMSRMFLHEAFSLFFTEDSLTREWTTPLHVAVVGGHARTVHWLITEAGCCVHRKDSSGQTPLDIALRVGKTDIVALLVRLDETSVTGCRKNEGSAEGDRELNP